MKKVFVLLLILGLLVFASFGECAPLKTAPIGMAVEFMDHAACAYISQDKGWFEEEGLNLTAYESYVTGMALASALARGDIQVAYMCLIPAINVYANARVPIKIITGTHKYGYGLVVNPDKIKSIKDLEGPDIRIGCVREGGAVDVLLHKTIDLSLIHISEPTRLGMISYAVFCLKKKTKQIISRKKLIKIIKKKNDKRNIRHIF